MKNDLSIIILAAGKGTRMKSAKPKVMHEIGGLPVISHVIKTAEKLKPQKIVVVVATGMNDIAQIVKPHVTAIQKSQNGTGDAVKSALPALKGTKGDVLVLYGDVPLVRSEDLKALVKLRTDKKAGIALMTMTPVNAGNYGRIVLNKDGTLKNIVEAKDASAEEKKIKLCNSGIMCIDAAKISAWLGKINDKNKQKEFFLQSPPLKIFQPW